MKVSGSRMGLYGLMWRVIKWRGRGGGRGWEVIDHISWTINSAFRFTRMEKKNVFMRSVFLSLD